MSFGDVNLRDGRIIQGPDGGEMKPGRAGWPTIRYFNAKTGCAPPSTPALPALAPPLLPAAGQSPA